MYPLAVTRKYIALGLKGKFKIGASEHEYVASVDRNWATSYGGEWKDAFGIGKPNYSIQGNSAMGSTSLLADFMDRR